MRALEAFPPGHPSSPYQADGSRRPAEPSLRSLELPIPDEIAQEWGIGIRTSDRTKGANERENSGDWSTAWTERGAGPNTPDADGGRDHDVGRTGETRGQAGEAGDGFIPVGREKQGTADNTAGRTRDGGAQTADAVPPPEGTHRYYWTEVPRFNRIWSDHESAWPKESQPAAKIDRSGDPPGSWRSDSNLFLSPDNHVRAKDAINRSRDAEPHITADLQNVMNESPASAEFVGLEFRCKGEERLKEKVTEALRRRTDSTPEETVQNINDAIRYTVRLSREDYVVGHQIFTEGLQRRGYEPYYQKNHWDDPEYKGVNTRWLTPNGQKFELQFHTPESYHAKQEVTHEAYERLRNRMTSRAEVAELKAFQRAVSSWIPVPDGAKGIPSFRKDEQ